MEVITAVQRGQKSLLKFPDNFFFDVAFEQ
jgi:hypothetical protein